MKVSKLNSEDKSYPRVLKKIKNYPKSIYYRGSLTQNLFKKSLAIVGSRRMTQYGRQAVEKIVADLVAEKVTIISGFMYGVDTEAHQRCLEYGGLTVAVLGSGLDVIYPPENEKLYQQILTKGGAIISEYEPDFKPQLWTFPQRSRIVAGLASLGVLVVEAGEKSGSLITARLAKEQGKKVFAVPGPITSSVSIGTNYLIKSHQAKMITCAADILGKKTSQPNLFATDKLNPTEKKIFQALETEPLSIDELVKLTNQTVAEVSKIISLMSLKGLIREAAGKFYLTS